MAAALWQRKLTALRTQAEYIIAQLSTTDKKGAGGNPEDAENWPKKDRQ